MLLSLSKLKKSYRNGEVVTPVLHGIDLNVEAGEYIAVMGQSGSGKSTLMNLLGLLDVADAGSYHINGIATTGQSASRHAELRSRTIGFVFQNFNLLKSMTVLENIALPLIYAGSSRASAQLRAQRLLIQVGLEALGGRMPNQLSGGQQQRVAIARALVNEPQLLLADEPTGNLDTRTTEEVLGVFEQLNRERGLAIVMVTHEPEVAHHAKRLVRLREGAVAFDGSPKEGAYT
jgi:putative ABC transport system ATP-binding protein